ncbi:Uncharacterised protein [Mycobacterium tuberculosis]|uniref:Uncharacterized protein n=2 Tax=Mycobacterium tuberculosis TaxID=1773 RepID=A0A0T7PLC6_MYCTX|nr:Uncharacterised protein [Mycobacterium tuberculosis]CFE57430.1 Uncharacterised protein [Mycobacterium tuberculosis]CFS07207.1 Uncharacterised protein [Mycobacterium tuberculosis]CKR17565.1 Uncharacterised protein [Mycobacterium tuberculosis]CKR93445.1 Uncharacterised protein [Mycobacterium tuberculosis]
MPILERVASTPVTVNAGCGAGGGRDRNAAHPTPIWRCGSSPESHDTMIVTSCVSGAARCNRAAMRATLVSRDEVAATSIEVMATS